MSRRHHGRRQSRRSLLWHVFYGSSELVGQGSIVDVHEKGCRIAGCMPVDVSTHLRLCIWPTDNPTDIVVVQGSVMWTRGLEFGLLLDRPMPTVGELATLAGSVPLTFAASAKTPYKPVGGGLKNDA
jgi:hypothetical protein